MSAGRFSYVTALRVKLAEPCVCLVSACHGNPRAVWPVDTVSHAPICHIPTVSGRHSALWARLCGSDVYPSSRACALLLACSPLPLLHAS